MALKKLVVSEYGVKIKATIQASGKLSFTDATTKNLELGENTRFAIYQDDKTPLERLYMVAVLSIFCIFFVQILGFCLILLLMVRDM